MASTVVTPLFNFSDCLNTLEDNDMWGNPWPAGQRDVPRFEIEFVHLDMHARLIPAEDVGDDMPRWVAGCLLGRKDTVPDHLGNLRMILRQLIKLAAGQKVATGIAGVGDEQAPIDDEGQRQHRPHAGHFRVPRGLLENPRVGLQERSLELF